MAHMLNSEKNKQYIHLFKNVFPKRYLLSSRTSFNSKKEKLKDFSSVFI